MPGRHKSPLYKGIGKYKKKAKGKRGYTMKSPYKMFGALGSLMGGAATTAAAAGGEGNGGGRRRRMLGGGLFGNIFGR
tara:strand:- start:790 stop:1023 length:234 start_codon:yes stop_codon:yes gene_type:complete